MMQIETTDDTLSWLEIVTISDSQIIWPVSEYIPIWIETCLAIKKNFLSTIYWSKFYVFKSQQNLWKIFVIWLTIYNPHHEEMWFVNHWLILETILQFHNVYEKSTWNSNLWNWCKFQITKRRVFKYHLFRTKYVSLSPQYLFLVFYGT